MQPKCSSMPQATATCAITSALEHFYAEAIQPPTSCAKLYYGEKLHGFGWQKAIAEKGEEFGLAEDWGWRTFVPGMPNTFMHAETHVFNVDCADAAQLTWTAKLKAGGKYGLLWIWRGNTARRMSWLLSACLLPSALGRQDISKQSISSLKGISSAGSNSTMLLPTAVIAWIFTTQTARGSPLSTWTAPRR